MPSFYDKLLPVPILNLCVPLIELLARGGLIGRFQRWESQFHQRKLNLVHMGCWAGLFVAMWTSSFVEAPHPGASVEFSQGGQPRCTATALAVAVAECVPVRCTAATVDATRIEAIVTGAQPLRECRGDNNRAWSFDACSRGGG